MSLIRAKYSSSILMVEVYTYHFNINKICFYKDTLYFSFELAWYLCDFKILIDTFFSTVFQF